MHKRHSRLMIGLAAIVTAGLALTGCSPSAGGDTTADGKTKVVFWQQKFEDYQQAWYKEQVAAYNKSQDKVEVQIQVIPADVWDQKLKAAQAAGKAPDVKTTNYGNIKPGQRNGELTDLTKFMDQKSFDDISDNVKDFVTVDGGVYGYPMLVEPSTVLFYRTDLYKAAGIAAPPTTWDELIDDARKLTQGKTFGMNIAQTAPDLGWSSWGLQYNSAGSLPMNDDWSKATATDPAYVELADFYKTLYTEKLMPQEATYGYADCSFYGEGTVAMSACGSWAIGQLAGNPDWKDVLANTAVAPFPSKDGDATKPTATLGGWTLTVDSKSKVQKEAAGFVEWLAAGDPQIMVDFFKASGFSKYATRTSVNDALAKDPEASANPFMGIVSKEIVPFAKAEPSYPWEISLAFSTGLEKAMRGGDTKAALAEAEAAMNDVIAKQKLAGTAP